MDTFDGLFAGKKKRLKAMKDSKVGSFGVQSLVFITLIQIACLLKIQSKIVFILPICSLFTKSLYPKILSLFLLIIIQFLWVIENRCILNEENQSLGYGDITSIATITLNTLLSFQIGKLI